MFTPLFHIGSHSYSLYSLILLFTAIAAIAMAVRVVIREKGSLISWSFVAPTSIMACWLFGRAMAGSAGAMDVAEGWARASYLAFPLLPAAFAQFAFVAVNHRKRPRLFLTASWIAGAVFSVIAVTTPLIIAGVWSYRWGFYPRYGPYAWVFLIFFGVLGTLSLATFIRAVQRLPECRQRRRLTQFALAYGAGFVGVIDYLPAYGIELVPFGHIAALATIVLIGHSIRKYQLFDITPAFAAQNVVSTMAEALIVTDDEGRIRIVNDAACRLCGRARAELIGTPLLMLLSSERDGDRELFTADGPPIPVSVTVSTLMDGDRRAGTVFIAHDMRERLRIEESLREKELLLRTEEVRKAAELEYRTLVESISEGIVHFDVHDVVRYLNDRAAAMLGVTREDAIGAKVDAVIGAIIGVDKADRSLARREVAIATQDGTTRWLEVGLSPVLDERGRAIGSICLLSDITDRHRARQAVLASAREWRETFDAIRMPLLILDANGVVQRANRAAFERACVGEDGIGRPVAQLGSFELWGEIDRLVRSGPATHRVQFQDKSGAAWDLALDAIGDRDEEQRIVVAARDITAIVQLQQSLRRSETMSALGTLVGGVAHEVRNPLFAMSSTLDAFAIRFGTRDEYRDFAATMRTQVDRVSNLMSDLLEYGRPAPAPLVPHSIEGPLDEAIANCTEDAERGAVAIVVDVADANPVVAMNERRLQQALCNLIRNAVQHSPRGGTVRVRIESTTSSGGEPHLAVIVSDQGPGFNPAELRQVFEPFFTRRRGGTGLGLAIARAIVEQHHGTIKATNSAERGAVVSIELPMNR